jgi:hypothetical protein
MVLNFFVEGVFQRVLNSHKTQNPELAEQKDGFSILLKFCAKSDFGEFFAEKVQTVIFWIE